MPTAIEKQEITLTEAMRLTGYTKQNLQKLIEAGHLRRSDRAKFKLADLFGGVMAHLRSQRKTRDQTAAAQRLLEARATEIEQRTSIRAGKLMETDEHFAIMHMVFGALKATIESLPAQMTRDPDQRRRADKVVSQALARCAENLERLATAEEQTDEEEDDHEEA
ncbi:MULTISPECIES: hypothetical protein [unclassified Bradyrhizobium]|uniref:hypothetical protein n=1 Tax=unclassified Bradyrhizobium TaxID=2631580 RepID=UPI0028E960B5|nr:MULTISPECIES: hypothetical protein [unclassified Bradyrhizobium]